MGLFQLEIRWFVQETEKQRRQFQSLSLGRLLLFIYLKEVQQFWGENNLYCDVMLFAHPEDMKPVPGLHPHEGFHTMHVSYYNLMTYA